MERETMHIVIVGHVDHGKSTLVGRLLADTGTLGESKLEAVRGTCRRQGKEFEYAFLLDALEAEQDQGITIDAARVFFGTEKREYVIIDAPGHIEFLKNMVTGASRAEAAMLLIDAKEGVRENSRRHGYLMSMLGIRQVVVAVNKMDLVDYDRGVFDSIVKEYRAFLSEIGIEPRYFIPISARAGDQIVGPSENLDWYDGPSVLQAVDGFEKQPTSANLPLRMPVQDVYKFNERGDDARIIAGRVESGRFSVGDRVLFSPSNKTGTIASIPAFSAPEKTNAEAGQSTGLRLVEEIFVPRGEVMSHVDDAPGVSTLLRVNLFWLGREPMRVGQGYRLKLATAQTDVTVHEIHRILDASELDTSIDKQQIDRHDVADVVLRTRKPVSFDRAADIESMGRFVIVDGYDIGGGGIVRELVDDDQSQQRLESKIRDLEWVRGDVTNAQRAKRLDQRASMVMFVGEAGVGKHAIARALERRLSERGKHPYLLDGKNVFLGVDADMDLDNREELVRRFGEVAHLFLDAGLIVISTTNVIGLADHTRIQTQISPVPMFVVHIGAANDKDGTGADLRLEPTIGLEAAVDAIITELDARQRLASVD